MSEETKNIVHTRLSGSGELELDFFPVDERGDVTGRGDERVVLPVGNVGPPELLLVISKVGTMNGVRNAALSLQNLLAPKIICFVTKSFISKVAKFLTC